MSNVIKVFHTDTYSRNQRNSVTTQQLTANGHNDKSQIIVGPWDGAGYKLNILKLIPDLIIGDGDLPF